ncbi:MAG: beta-1,4-galactosyltransferase [Candidatus Diapherotrites archaeon]|nr:beta-1,4-galactosyltransferase [Candidatus Diapherotrites archaeon]
MGKKKLKVFVTLGTHPQQFNRLINEIEKLAEKNIANFFVQYGNSKKPKQRKNLNAKKFLLGQEYENAFKRADVIVSHAGAGSIIAALEFKKPLIIIPRLKKFAEHTDDHQIDLAYALDKRGKAIAILNEKELEKALKKAAKFKPSVEREREKLTKAISELLGAWCKN